MDETITAPVSRPIVGVCSLGGRWFWVCWPGQANAAFDMVTVPLGSGYALEKGQAQNAAIEVAIHASGDGRWLQVKPGVAKEYHRYRAAQQREGKARAKAPVPSSRPTLRLVRWVE